jgi:hypothetical protein
MLVSRAEIGSQRRRVRRAGVWLAALIPAVGLVSLAGPAQRAAASGSGCATPVVKPVGPFHIASDNRTILDKNGRRFISYGTTVPGLSNPKLTTFPSKDIPKINATADVWCGNTVRLQVSQYAVTHNTTIDNGGCENTYLNKALDPEVKQAEADGLVVVINDQTESDPLGNSEREPSKATFRFWDCVTAHQESWHSAKETYAQDPQVVFDIFNEPRADACPKDNGPNGPYEMNLWRNGGRSDGICGPVENYQGMDAVAFHIRVEDHDTTTLLWVEGPGLAGTLAGLAKTECGSTPTGNCFITPSLGPLVYSVHHPYGSDVTNSKSPTADPSTWWAEFGWVIDRPDTTAGRAPVVIGEWTNFDSFNGAGVGPGSSCWSDAPAQVPNFLSYLKALGVGLNAYQLGAPKVGYLLKATGNFTDTTNYTDASWKSSYCIPRHKAPLLAAGSLIRKWFQQQN